MGYVPHASRSPQNLTTIDTDCVCHQVRPDIWDKFQTRFGVKVNELFGATEGNVSTVNYWGKPGAIGFQGPLFRWLNKPTYPRMVKVDMDTKEIIRDPKTGFCIECAPGEPGECIGRMIADNFVGYYKNESGEFDGSGTARSFIPRPLFWLTGPPKSISTTSLKKEIIGCAREICSCGTRTTGFGSSIVSGIPSDGKARIAPRRGSPEQNSPSLFLTILSD